MDRRSILKMFGIGAAAAATGVVATQADGVALKWTDHPIDRTPWKDPFKLDFQPPEGMTYQWKRMFIDSETPDVGNIEQLIQMGWKPVPWHRHNEGNFSHYWFEHEGLVLMEKPTAELSQARACPVPTEEKRTGEKEVVRHFVMK